VNIRVQGRHSDHLDFFVRRRRASRFGDGKYDTILAKEEKEYRGMVSEASALDGTGYACRLYQAHLDESG
jgi:hypothetical protein